KPRNAKITIQIIIYMSLSNNPQWYTWSAMLKNLKARASSRKPKTTLTEFSQEPDLGRLLSHSGKTAKRPKGMAKAREKASMPNMGCRISPPAEAINMDPTIGPVQEKETNTKVKAIKNMPVNPPLSPLASTLLTRPLGRVNSNKPRNARPKKTNTRKKKTLGSQWVDSQLANSGPWVAATKVPAKV